MAAWVLGAALALPARGWLVESHYGVASQAVDAVADELPAAWTAQRALVVQAAADPDLFALPAGGVLRAAERPEHFFDLEHLADEAIPATREDFRRWCASNSVEAASVGFLPYAIEEWTERLTLSFAALRQDPTNAARAALCAVYAGILAHYTADLAQPLHCTMHYDGRVAAPGAPSPRTGFHRLVDGLPAWLPAPDCDVPEAVPSESLRDSIVADLRASHAWVERVYALEPQVRALSPGVPPDPELAALVEACVCRAVTWTAQYWRHAWRASATVRAPPWAQAPRVPAR